MCFMNKTSRLRSKNSNTHNIRNHEKYMIRIPLKKYLDRFILDYNTEFSVELGQGQG